MPAQFNMPGVFINELNALPNSVVPVETAVPAFIGYTARAFDGARGLTGQPTEIGSISEFLQFYGALTQPIDGTIPVPADDKRQYTPRYRIVAAAERPGDITLGGKPFDVQPDPATLYFLYQSLQLFYANGGGKCFVVSVGPYRSVSGPATSAGATPVNPNVRYAELKAALDSLQPHLPVTLIVIPDALLLKFDEYQTLVQDVLQQCGTLQNRMGIFDVYGGEIGGSSQPNPVEQFRTAVGSNHLAYGAAYYPFLKTTITPEDAVDCHTLGGPAALAPLLPEAGLEPVKSILSQMETAGGPSNPSADNLEQALRLNSPSYKDLHRLALQKMNVLPAAGAIAGIYTQVDSTRGVWKAPANVSLNRVPGVTVQLTDREQEAMNIDVSTGKSINAIRTFPGRGTVVWGARTLAGNSNEWRYISVRRTMIMVEESVRLAIRAYVFEPNIASTWTTIQGMLENFLLDLWKDGALLGTVPSQAFFVRIGLGKTMTEQDVLNGILRVEIGAALVRPAEFIIIALQQQMQTA